MYGLPDRRRSSITSRPRKRIRIVRRNERISIAPAAGAAAVTTRRQTVDTTSSFARAL